MKNYELTVVFHPDLEMNLDPALDKVKKIIESNGGEIIKEENEGKKRLSYTVAGQDFGIYDFVGELGLNSSGSIGVLDWLCGEQTRLGAEWGG